MSIYLSVCLNFNLSLFLFVNCFGPVECLSFLSCMHVVLSPSRITYSNNFQQILFECARSKKSIIRLLSRTFWSFIGRMVWWKCLLCQSVVGPVKVGDYKLYKFFSSPPSNKTIKLIRVKEGSCCCFAGVCTTLHHILRCRSLQFYWTFSIQSTTKRSTKPF